MNELAALLKRELLKQYPTIYLIYKLQNLYKKENAS